ncbi:MAG TPA: hypothetical protein VGN12_06915 [Pirellulales bacterium]|jgi:hypothetical protein
MARKKKPRSDSAELDRAYEFINTFGAKSSIGDDDERARNERVLSEARQTIVSGIESVTADEEIAEAVLIYSYASLCQLPGYATLNQGHIRRIREVVQRIEEYHKDRTLKRPLNFLVLADPGSGKSQLVKSVAKKLGDSPITLVPFNMATMQSKEDFLRVLDAARNVVIDGKLPLVFLDEFDCDERYYPLLLPLLWDGELGVANRDLRLGRSVFFLAGSRHSLPKRLGDAREMFTTRGRKHVSNEDDKLVDLFSRINGGVIEVPSLTATESRADKVALAMHLLRHRFKSCVSVPRGLLAFIARAHFSYEARSIATVVDAIRVPDPDSLLVLNKNDLASLPFANDEVLKESPLAFHLADEYGAQGLSNCWNKAITIEGDQMIRDSGLDERRLGTLEWAQFAALQVHKLPSTPGSQS